MLGMCEKSYLRRVSLYKVSKHHDILNDALISKIKNNTDYKLIQPNSNGFTNVGIRLK